MGHKVHPKALRLGIVRDWDARWFAHRDFANLLHEDLAIRNFITKRFRDAGISRTEIERAATRLTINMHAARPGMIIGRGGSGVERLRQDLEKLTGKQVSLNVLEVKVAELDAQLVAESVAAQLVRRVAFRRAIKQALGRTRRAGAKGVKIQVSGRLGGAELARTEWSAEGSVPLHTFRADVDYGFAEAHTTYGQIGVKCWINRGEILPEREKTPRHEGMPAQQRPAPVTVETQSAVAEPAVAEPAAPEPVAAEPVPVGPAVAAPVAVEPAATAVVVEVAPESGPPAPEQPEQPKRKARRVSKKAAEPQAVEPAEPAEPGEGGND